MFEQQMQQQMGGITPSSKAEKDKKAAESKAVTDKVAADKEAELNKKYTDTDGVVRTKREIDIKRELETDRVVSTQKGQKIILHHSNKGGGSEIIGHTSKSRSLDVPKGNSSSLSFGRDKARRGFRSLISE